MEIYVTVGVQGFGGIAIHTTEYNIYAINYEIQCTLFVQPFSASILAKIGIA